MKGEIDDAQDSLRLLETQDTALQRAKKLYTQSVEQYVKQQKKMEKSKGETNPKTKHQVYYTHNYSNMNIISVSALVNVDVTVMQLFVCCSVFKVSKWLMTGVARGPEYNVHCAYTHVHVYTCT